MKLSIIIPVFNEARTVRTLLERVWNQVLPGVEKELVIIESNSTDGSREIVSAFAEHRACTGRVRLILQEQARGKGAAIRAGLAAASGEVLLIQDADLEYEVSDYPDLLQPILEGRAAFVLGSRHLGASRWKIRQFARRGLQSALMNVGDLFFRIFFNTLYAVRLTDPTTMYKVFRAECLEGLRFRCERFDFDFELLGQLLRAGYRPLEIPVSYRSRGFDEGKKIRVLRDPPTWIAAIVRTRCARIARRAPQQWLTLAPAARSLEVPQPWRASNDVAAIPQTEKPAA